MAILYFNAKSRPVMAVKEENDLKIHRGDLDVIKAAGRCKTISTDDYNSYIALEKTARLDGSTVVFENPVLHQEADKGTIPSDVFDVIKDDYLEKVNHILESKGSKLNESAFSGLKTRLEGFKTGLENVDKSSITFPINTSFIRYWIDNESSEPFDINFL